MPPGCRQRLSGHLVAEARWCAGPEMVHRRGQTARQMRGGQALGGGLRSGKSRSTAGWLSCDCQDRGACEVQSGSVHAPSEEDAQVQCRTCVRWCTTYSLASSSSAIPTVIVLPLGTACPKNSTSAGTSAMSGSMQCTRVAKLMASYRSKADQVGQERLQRSRKSCAHERRALDKACDLGGANRS